MAKFIDEVEARWTQLLEEQPTLSRSEVMWGTKWPGSLELVVDAIAQLIGGMGAEVLMDRKPHIPSSALRDTTRLLRAMRADRSYQQKMNFDFVPG